MTNMLEDKEIEKANRDLIELHKRVILTHLTQVSVKAKTRKKFFTIYDHYINTNNIRHYFFRDIELFIKALILGRVDEIEDYIEKKKTKRRRK